MTAVVARYSVSYQINIPTYFLAVISNRKQQTIYIMLFYFINLSRFVYITIIIFQCGLKYNF